VTLMHTREPLICQAIGVISGPTQFHDPLWNNQPFFTAVEATEAP
jgi:hypothetical protein